MTSDGECVEFQACANAFNKRLSTFNIVNKVQRTDIQSFLNDAYKIYQKELMCILEKYNIVKSLSILAAEFEKKVVQVNDVNLPNASNSTVKEDVIKQTLYFSSSNVRISFHDNLNVHYQKNVVSEILKSVENAAIQGSGFTLSQILHLNVQISLYEPLNGSSFIETPKILESKKAIVNVQNLNDEMCFKWAILSALHPHENNPQRLSHYKQFENELNFRNINFPVNLKDIDKFEQQNNTISINVYYYDDAAERVLPLRVSNVVKHHHIHLMLLVQAIRLNNSAYTTADKINVMLECDDIRSHYCWIKNLSRLVSNQLSKHDHASFICDRCLNYYKTSVKLMAHSKNCVNDIQIEMPMEFDKWIKFKNFQNQLKAPFIVYADTEAFLKCLDDEDGASIFNEACSTKAYQKHVAYSVGYYFKCEYDDSQSYYASSGINLNCIDWFVNELRRISQYVASILMKKLPMEKMTSEEEKVFNDPHTICFICEQPFEVSDVRVRDHCHITGKYRGPAHVNCNLNYQISHTIPIVMHNLSGYDAHLFIKELAIQMNGDLTIIPNNTEQYIAFTKVVNEDDFVTTSFKDKIKLKFIDSCRFMPSSLSTLASFLPSDKKRVLYTESLKLYPIELVHMLERKGVFPYDYVDSIQRLEERSLPSKSDFYSELNDEEIDDDEYKFACEMWEKFNIKTLGEYSDLYLKTDVLLLTDIFENFREICHKIYKLDPAHYFTSPGLSFDAMLKYTNIEIELMTDVDMLLFVERGIRGGITQCNQRYIQANNKYMKAGFNMNEKTNFIMYLDGEINFHILIYFRIII